MKPEFLLYTRENCHLCGEMRRALHAAAHGSGYACHLIDVDQDPDLQRRFGSRVPVLAAEGQVLCEAVLDAAVVAAYLHRAAQQG